MKYDNLSVLELRKLLDNKEVTTLELFNNSTSSGCSIKFNSTKG